MNKGLVHGFGINDADYTVNPLIDGKRVMCKAYKSWMAMIRRCHCRILHGLHPTYIGVTVCEEWRYFMRFREWWSCHHVDGWHLDKDLLTDNREYSPENCIYIPTWLNNFTIDGGSRRGEWPIGVSYIKSEGMFSASCSNPLTKKGGWIGRFSSPDDAYRAWKSRKLQLALEMKCDMDAIDKRIYSRVVEIINRAK